MKTKTIKVISGGTIGAATGLTTSTAAIYASGTAVGLSGPGIMSGLAAIGGTALGGIAIVSLGTVATTIAGGYIGYKLFRRSKPEAYKG